MARSGGYGRRTGGFPMLYERRRNLSFAWHGADIVPVQEFYTWRFVPGRTVSPFPSGRFQGGFSPVFCGGYGPALSRCMDMAVILLYFLLFSVISHDRAANCLRTCHGCAR